LTRSFSKLKLNELQKIILYNCYSCFFTFDLVSQWQKSQEVDPEILAQYTISLEVEEFLDLVKRLKK
jgi:hypothetical protein